MDQLDLLFQLIYINVSLKVFEIFLKAKLIKSKDEMKFTIISNRDVIVKCKI